MMLDETMLGIRLGVTDREARQMMEARDVPVVELPNGQLRVPLDAYEAWVRERIEGGNMITNMATATRKQLKAELKLAAKLREEWRTECENLATVQEQYDRGEVPGRRLQIQHARVNRLAKRLNQIDNVIPQVLKNNCGNPQLLEIDRRLRHEKARLGSERSRHTGDLDRLRKERAVVVDRLSVASIGPDTRADLEKRRGELDVVIGDAERDLQRATEALADVETELDENRAAMITD